jgi:hypothetical protein
MAVGSAHAARARHRRPVGPDTGTDQAAGGTDHPRVQIEQHGVVGKPIKPERGAVIAPRRGAVDQQLPAAVAADVAHGDGVEGLSHVQRAFIRGPTIDSAIWRIRLGLQ